MNNYPTETHTYRYLWNKYRPAILKLMIDAEGGPQQYKFSNHEFKTAHPTQKGGYSFELKVFQGKAVNDIRTSVVAKDLLAVLQQSRKASELSSTSAYEFVLDRQHVLHIKQEEMPVEEQEQAEEDI